MLGANPDLAHACGLALIKSLFFKLKRLRSLKRNHLDPVNHGQKNHLKVFKVSVSYHVDSLSL